MEALNAQVVAVVDELSTLRAEIIQIKSAHAALHQGAVENNAQSAKRYEEQFNRINQLEEKFEDIVAKNPGGSIGGF